MNAFLCNPIVANSSKPTSVLRYQSYENYKALPELPLRHLHQRSPILGRDIRGYFAWRLGALARPPAHPATSRGLRPARPWGVLLLTSGQATRLKRDPDDTLLE
jgi:hypothetical protein